MFWQNNNTNHNFFPGQYEINQEYSQNELPMHENGANCTQWPQNQKNENYISPRKIFLSRLRDIPIFNAESYSELIDFISTVDILEEVCQNEYEYKEFLIAIRLKLRGRARIVTQNNLNNWDDIKNILKNNFNYLNNREAKVTELENIRQSTNESLSKYSKRIRKLFDEILNTYECINADVIDILDRVAKRAYINGILSSKLKENLITRGARTLEDAIGGALEIENYFFNAVSNSEFYCNFCGACGHRERDCNERAMQNGQVGALMSALKRVMPNGRGYEFENNQIYSDEIETGKENENVIENDYDNQNESEYRQENRDWDCDETQEDADWNEYDRNDESNSFGEQNWNYNIPQTDYINEINQAYAYHNENSEQRESNSGN